MVPADEPGAGRSRQGRGEPPGEASDSWIHAAGEFGSERAASGRRPPPSSWSPVRWPTAFRSSRACRCACT